MNIYLASRYSRLQELLGVRARLRDLGHTVTSHWLDGDYPTDEKGRSLEAEFGERSKVAVQDLDDVLAADMVISFTESPRSDGRGGRHVEFGAAAVTGKLLVIVGPREHVFHCLPFVKQFDAWDECEAFLRRNYG